MIFSHKITLDVTHRQREYFSRAAGCDRFCWNLCLAEWNRRHESGEKRSGAAIKKDFNTFKYEAFPWMDGLHRDAHADAFERVGDAWSRYFKALKIGNKTTGRPKFHKKGRRESFYVSNDRLNFSKDGFRVKLPVIGEVGMRERLRYQGKIIGATVLRIADRWFINIRVDVVKVRKKDEWVDIEKRRTGNGIIGVDVGLQTAAVVSGGTEFQAPKPLKKALKKLRRLQRKASRQIKGGKNQKKTYRRVANVHARCENVRKDHWDKITTKLCSENQAVGIETLNVKGMLKNRKLARALSDAAFGEFARQMAYKAIIFDVKLVKADRWYPSSKTCSKCGHVKETLSLAERVFHCDHCGLEIDRDLNAAINLMKLAMAEVEKSKLPTACGEVKPAKEERLVKALGAAGTKPIAHSCALTN